VANAIGGRARDIAGTTAGATACTDLACNATGAGRNGEATEYPPANKVLGATGTTAGRIEGVANAGTAARETTGLTAGGRCGTNGVDKTEVGRTAE
jgi:hypothetical protein